LDTAGIITRSALDASVLFALAMTPEQQVAVMPEFNDAANRLADGSYNYQTAKKPVRITTVTNHPNQRFNAIPSVRDAILSVAEQFSDAAVEHHTTLDDLPEIVKKANTILHVEASATHTQRLRSSSSELSAITRAVALPGAAIPSSWYVSALQQRNTILTRFLDRYFSSNDILLTPVLPLGIPNWESVLTTSPRFESTALLALFSWTSFVNYLGLPAVVFPIGLDANGLPISIQAIARPYNESTLLAFAHQAECKLSGTSQATFRSF
ncbi:amidase family protein, partial [Photobacterium phosphoreum]|uniref:amidase family protein n=1 Tax=Photobacterium phosphoreum TaxID=659 RepID=UPI001E5E9885